MGVPVRRRSSSELQFDSGDRVGPYQIVRRVAPSCYDAEALASGAPVRIELATEADSALIDIRFTRAQSQLDLVDHPLVAKIIDHGVLSNGRPWVASELPVGTALSDVLAERRLEPREVTALIYSVAQVLAFAHHRQVVHGSLRPHHLTLSRGAKVSLSGWAWLRTPGIPAFGDPANTSVYNPPEHDGQSPIDGRADVYALGAIAYRALTGVFPDVSRDLLDANEPLGAAIENMLSLDARDRNSAAAIVADLHEQRVADRAAAKERASMRDIDAPERASLKDIEARPHRASSASIETDDDRLVRAEKEIEELRARRASSPRIEIDEPRPKRASSPNGVEGQTRRAASSRPDVEGNTRRAASPRPDVEGNTRRAPSSRPDVDEPRAKRPSSPGPHVIDEPRAKRPSSPSEHEGHTRRAPSSRPDVDEPRAKRPSSPGPHVEQRHTIDEPHTSPAPSPRSDVDEPHTRRAPPKHELDERNTDRKSAASSDDPDLEKRRTRPMSTPANGTSRPRQPTPANGTSRPRQPTPSSGIRRPPTPSNGIDPRTPTPMATSANDIDIDRRTTTPMATPANGVERSTRPMSAVEYAAQDLGEPHTDRRRRFVSIESALHDGVEPNTDPARRIVSIESALHDAVEPTTHRPRRIISIESALHDAVEPNTDRMAPDLEQTDLATSMIDLSTVTDVDVLA